MLARYQVMIASNQTSCPLPERRQPEYSYANFVWGSVRVWRHPRPSRVLPMNRLEHSVVPSTVRVGGWHLGTAAASKRSSVSHEETRSLQWHTQQGTQRQARSPGPQGTSLPRILLAWVAPHTLCTPCVVRPRAGLALPSFPQHTVSVKYATEHRCGIAVSGPGLSDSVSGTDPLKDDLPLMVPQPLDGSEEVSGWAWGEWVGLR